MRIVLLALALMPAAAMARDGDKAAAPAAAAPAKCQNARTQLVKAPSAQPKKLAQEPMANQYLGVLRLEDGCDTPVMIREGVDGTKPRR